MDRLYYAGHSVVTGTAIAHALMEYAQALSQAGAAATIAVPTVNNDGSHGRSEILIGPSSQMITDVEESDQHELCDDQLVTFMREEAERIRRHGMETSPAMARSPQPRDWSDPEY